jgi:hypothetical protein
MEEEMEEEEEEKEEEDVRKSRFSSIPLDKTTPSFSFWYCLIRRLLPEGAAELAAESIRSL